MSQITQEIKDELANNAHPKLGRLFLNNLSILFAGDDASNKQAMEVGFFEEALKLEVAVMAADGEIADAERELFYEFTGKFGIPQEVCDALIAAAPHITADQARLVAEKAQLVDGYRENMTNVVLGTLLIGTCFAIADGLQGSELNFLYEAAKQVDIAEEMVDAAVMALKEENELWHSWARIFKPSS
ncbi:MAG: TerB family tellurite resistance protein [Chloroflexota bacterium]